MCFYNNTQQQQLPHSSRESPYQQRSQETKYRQQLKFKLLLSHQINNNNNNNDFLGSVKSEYMEEFKISGNYYIKSKYNKCDVQILQESILVKRLVIICSYLTVISSFRLSYTDITNLQK
eukprot:EC096784.1.p2 GENE.EC096784.1~~EC096784.1.p2  ORF type:complete len:120 (-),score=6.91 EC096784.1:298-657(-)